MCAIIVLIGCFVTGWEQRDGVTEAFALVGVFSAIGVSLFLNVRDDNRRRG